MVWCLSQLILGDGMETTNRMETAGLKIAEHEPSASTCFETRQTKKIAAKLNALIFVLIGTLVSGLLICTCFACGPFIVPILMIVGFVAVIVITLAVYFRQRILPGLRFCMIFHQDFLQVGRLLAKRSFHYESVDRIQASREEGVRIGCGSKTAAIFLDGYKKEECISLLRQRCPNAYFVDELGQHYLPVSPTRPEVTLAGIEYHHRRLAWVTVLSVCVVAYAALRMWLLGWNVIATALTAFASLFVCLGFWVAWRSWQIARVVRQERLRLRGCEPCNSAADSPDSGLDGPSSGDGAI
jgi:hypothetical protein